MIDMKKKATDILEDYSNSYSQVDLETLTKFLEQIKSEVIKEFAEKYKEHIKNFTGMFTDGMEFMVNLDAILFAVDFVADNLVKEMTEPTKLEHTSLCNTETYLVQESIVKKFAEKLKSKATEHAVADGMGNEIYTVLYVGMKDIDDTVEELVGD